ncbi:hypothetical protein L207DRAFT_630642 [Hyaloscypha variabilis F]|uniref:Uncharacterized protein n=1 Tax=Hyaloscypha variabilis (strain UAMH 11265 / GT02V1 / F) TaxID=1149755 RepID=A0A2J6S0I2_HYAVF|nr:hypothetical protein L207DRAFT_630642 [Hyaloscypha variabilis F]
MSLLQAAPDTVSSSVYQCVAWLCVPQNQLFQKEVLEAILEAYGGDRDLAWNMAFQQENVPLVVSLYKETLRFFSTAAFNHRRASKEIKIYNTVIPKGIAVTMNI